MRLKAQKVDLRRGNEKLAENSEKFAAYRMQNIRRQKNYSLSFAERLYSRNSFLRGLFQEREPALEQRAGFFI